MIMAKMTKAQAKRAVLAIQSKAFKLIGRPATGMDRTLFTIKDYEAITRICDRALNRLK
jgi:hypothetical protein